jgi:hypothetical protein
MNPNKRQASPSMASQENTKRTISTSEATVAGPSDIPPESIELPLQVIVSKDHERILAALQALIGPNDNNADFEYPIMIGSRAAAYWLPSFRPSDDWDLIATPQQAFNMLNDMKTEGLLSLSLVCQPLVKELIQSKSMKADIGKKIKVLPEYLYKVCGEAKGGVKFEIEITPMQEQPGLMLQTASAVQLFEICNTDVSIMKFPVGSKRGWQCIVAPVQVLEAIKCSHIHWPTYFPKHIGDIHTLRSVMPLSSSQVNIGLYADKNKPLTAPERTPQLEEFILTRTLEAEAFRGTPGAHINLNVSNKDFLERDDDLFVTRHIPHDDVHALVKYGDTPIYDQLKTDKSKAMVSKTLFAGAPYDLQIKCVKEEAMVIALERFLLPGLSSDPLMAYKFALVRICTTLTKGWFREFAIDNYPRLATCDKDLLPFRDEILQKHPLPPPVRDDPMAIIKQTVSNLDDLVTLQKLVPLTQETNRDHLQQMVDQMDRRDMEEGSDSNYGRSKASSQGDKYAGENASKHSEHCWTIQSNNPQNNSLVVTFINEAFYNSEECIPSNHFYATVSVQPLDKNTQLGRNDLREYHFSFSDWKVIGLDHKSFHKLSLNVKSTGFNGSWGVTDIWGDEEATCNGLSEEVKLLDLEGLTEDLLMTYLIAIIQPKLLLDGEVPFINQINRFKSDGQIPVQPKNHLWFDVWKFYA